MTMVDHGVRHRSTHNWVIGEVDCDWSAQWNRFAKKELRRSSRRSAIEFVIAEQLDDLVEQSREVTEAEEVGITRHSTARLHIGLSDFIRKEAR